MLSNAERTHLAPLAALAPSAGRAARKPDHGAPLSLAFVVLATAAGLMLVFRGASAAAVALMAGLTWSVSVVLSLKLLRLDAFSPAMIYLYLLGLFHLGLVIPWALGIESSRPPLWLNTHDLRPALSLVMVAIASYHAGAVVADWLWPPAEAGPATSFPSYNSVLCTVGLTTVTLGLLALCAGIYSLGFERLLRSDYAETYALASRYDPRFFATSMTFVPLGLYLAAASARRGVLPWVLCLGVLWGGCILFLGFRGYAFVPAVTIFAVLHKRGLRLPRIVYIVGLIAVLMLIPLVRAVRGDSLGVRGVFAVVPVAAPLAAVEEMGGSVRALVHTIEYLDTEPLRWGRTYWQALRSAVPNVAIGWQGGEYLPFERLPPSHWMTLQAAPHTYRAHGGLGFSAVAEPYMNFGTPGVAAYFFLLALALVAAYRFDRSSPTRLASWAVVVGPLLWTVRNDFHGFFRPVILGLAAIVVARLLANSWREPRRGFWNVPAARRTAGIGPHGIASRT